MTKNEIPEAVFQRLQKLYAKAESARELGSIAEAEAFSEKVQQLLLRYKMDMSQLTIEQKNEQEPIDRTGSVNWGKYEGTRRELWIDRLTRTVCNHFGCRYLVYSRSNSVCIVGRTTDRQMASYLLQQLVIFANATCDTEYWKERARRHRATGSWGMDGWKSSLLTGFVETIKHRLDVGLENVTGMALVLRRDLDQVDSWISEEYKDSKLTDIKYRKGRFDSHGYETGKQAGERASLAVGAVEKGKNDSTKKLRGN